VVEPSPAAQPGGKDPVRKRDQRGEDQQHRTHVHG
jgi:hypothetical protein